MQGLLFGVVGAVEKCGCRAHAGFPVTDAVVEDGHLSVWARKAFSRASLICD